MRYTRMIPIHGSVRAEVIAEMKNVFNTEQMSGFNSVVTTDAAGNPTVADSRRPYGFPSADRLRAAEIPVGFQGPF